MNLLFLLFLIAIILVILLFVVALRVIFTFNSDRANINLTLLWLYPILKVVVTNEDTGLVLRAYLFNKSVYSRTLKAGGNKAKTNKLDLVRQIRPSDVNVHAAYGFRDPFVTGVACGAVNIASQFINIDHMDQSPDFVADKDYIYVDATAKVKLGSALVNLYRARNSNSEKKKS